MAFTSNEPSPIDPDFTALVKEVKEKKRLRIAIYLLLEGGYLSINENANDITQIVNTEITYTDNLAKCRILDQLNNIQPGDPILSTLIKLIDITSIETSWAMQETWYHELIIDTLYDYNHRSNRWNSRNKVKSEDIDRFIKRTNGLSIKEKIDCTLDTYELLYNNSNEKIKSRIEIEYLKVEKIMDWLTTPPEQEADKTVHIKNAINKISKQEPPHGTPKEFHAKSIIIFNRNEKGFCPLVLSDAKKTWSQKTTREKGDKKQLGLSVKTETKQKLKSLSDKYCISETQVLEIIIRSEFKTEAHLKEYQKKVDAIDDI